MNDQDNNINSRQFIYTCPERVFNDSTITVNELKIYMIIRSFMDTTGVAYPSNQWIANRLQISVRKTIDNINRLVEKNYLERIISDGKRYLRIPTSPIIEQSGKSLIVTQTSCPHDAKVTTPHDAKVTLLYQSNITSKNIKERGKNAPTPILNDFLPTQVHEDFANENNIDLKKEVCCFIDYYQAHGKTMVNWNAAFSNWLRKSLDFRRNKNLSEHPVTASIREIKEVMRSREFLSMIN